MSASFPTPKTVRFETCLSDKFDAILQNKQKPGFVLNLNKELKKKVELQSVNPHLRGFGDLLEADFWDVFKEEIAIYCND